MPSESPKWIALVLSLAAITISALSWWEARRGRIVNEGVNRPVLVLTKTEAKGSWQEPEYFRDEEAAEVSFHLVFKNIGKSEAVFKLVQVRPGFTDRVFSKCTKLPDRSAAVLQDNLLPGLESEVVWSGELPPGCKYAPIMKFYLEILVAYADTNGQQHLQAFNDSVSLSGQKEKAK